MIFGKNDVRLKFNLFDVKKWYLKTLRLIMSFDQTFGVQYHSAYLKKINVEKVEAARHTFHTSLPPKFRKVGRSLSQLGLGFLNCLFSTKLKGLWLDTGVVAGATALVAVAGAIVHVTESVTTTSRVGLTATVALPFLLVYLFATSLSMPGLLMFFCWILSALKSVC